MPDTDRTPRKLRSFPWQVWHRCLKRPDKKHDKSIHSGKEFPGERPRTSINGIYICIN